MRVHVWVPSHAMYSLKMHYPDATFVPKCLNLP